MDANEVASYLKSHPEFFVQYADLLNRIHIPNPHGGKAISITERQLGNLREQVRALEARMAEMIRYGEDNDAVAGKIHRLSVALHAATDRPAAFAIIFGYLCDDFAVPHVALRLWGVGQGDSREFGPVDAAVQAFAAGRNEPYCGPATGQAAVAWFGDEGSRIRSMAQIPLHRNGQPGADCIGLLVLASEEAQRFYSEMGTVYLRQIGELAAATICRLSR
jgi:uncharacterized protein YigA (DUF484 family)